MYKAIKGYEGVYEINELGKIRSVDRTVEYKDGRIRKYKGKELKLKMDKGEYAIVQLQKNGVAKTFGVHRLVAKTFLSNPDNLPEVHHKNHDRKDNRMENLKWVTNAEQRDEHWRTARSKAKIKGTRLRVVGHGIDKIFISAHEVERELGVDSSTALKVAKEKFKQSKGYRIYFADQETETKEIYENEEDTFKR